MFRGLDFLGKSDSITAMKRLIGQIIAGIAGLWLAEMFVAGVSVKLYPDSNFFGIGLTEHWQIFLLLGIIIGLLNYFAKPVLDIITLPLRIITLGLLDFIIDIALILVVDILFKELSVPLYMPLIYTAIIIWGLNTLISIFLLKKE